MDHEAPALRQATQRHQERRTVFQIGTAAVWMSFDATLYLAEGQRRARRRGRVATLGQAPPLATLGKAVRPLADAADAPADPPPFCLRCTSVSR